MELLIKRAQKGDEEAFIEAIDTLMPQMYKVAKARLKNEEDIGDAIQETILSAFTNLKKVKEPVYFKTWITKILMNKCNDIVRKNKVLYVDEYGKVQGDQIVKNNIEQELEFDNMLSYLGVEYRLVIVLYYVNKFKTKEIAEILNEKEGTIKSRLHRARQQLKEYYLKEDWENLNNGGELK
ncbi:RNA polymerase sigma factor [Bacillus cereus]|uniref:RNA polymerase sigma factor n=1 Tax=Bacillus cereus TaxID=1396 RepID=UPI000BEDF528|nr:sigma-70 family RNA polymerase sigma factor [Bacillus cereus]PDY77422.1 RNA polymerase subunit sigma-70 [Bacillus cereus]PFM33681.1 RNA polymerase subunit sigma-70 [Bacillus cereus]